MNPLNQKSLTSKLCSLLLGGGLMLLIITANPLLSFAQTSSVDNTGSVVLEVNPRWPKPNETVRASVSGYGFTIGDSEISWYINNNRQKTGTGLNNFSFQAPALGQPLTLAVVVTPRIGNRVIKQLTFVPSAVDFLVEADTYTPLGYKGAALPGPYSKVKVVAIPNIVNGGNPVPAERINFTWEQDNQIQTNNNGTGRDYFIFKTGAYPGATTIKLTARAVNSGITAVDTITIPTVPPDFVLYPYLPLTGTKLEAVTSKLGGKGEISLKLEPYYLNKPEALNGSFIYNFTVNNKAIINQNSFGGILDLIIKDTSDIANIEVTITNLVDSLQKYTRKFNLGVDNNVSNF